MGVSVKDQTRDPVSANGFLDCFITKINQFTYFHPVDRSCQCGSRYWRVGTMGKYLGGLYEVQLLPD
jgi:hypothetical protein